MDKIDGRWQVPYQDMSSNQKHFEIWATPGHVAIADPVGEVMLVPREEASNLSKVLNHIAAESMLMELSVQQIEREIREQGCDDQDNDQ